MEKIIKMPKGAKYLSEVFYFGSEYGDSLPQNCIFNKVTTGCGGTYVALHSVRPTIIAVPTKALVKDKVTQSKYAHLNILPVSSEYPFVGIPKNCMKIICTYQSLPEVAKHIDMSKWDLVVDEMHLLNKMMNFSMTSLQWMMDNFKDFSSYCFMSATVSSDELLLKELRGIDRVTAEWQDIKTVSFECLHSKNIRDSIIQIACEHMDGTRAGNAYFFYNSVSGICNVIRFLKKNKCFKKEISVVAGKSEYTEMKLSAVGVKISDPSDYKKINFITSTAHEGVDFYDSHGVTYIVSDSNYSNSKYSLITTIPQIVGRLRDSEYSDIVTVLFNGEEFASIKTREELDAHIEHSLTQAGGFVRVYNNSKDRHDEQEAAEALFAHSLMNKYLRIKGVDVEIESIGSIKYIKGAEMEVYEDAKLSDLEEFELVRSNMYIIGKENDDHIAKKLTEKVGDAPILTNANRSKFVSKGVGVKALCEMYVENRDECFDTDQEVCQILDIIGVDNAERVNYKRDRMQEFALFITTKGSSDSKSKVLSKFKIGEVVTKADAKARLKECGISGAKATTISEYFNIEECSKNRQRAVRILSAK